MARQNSTDRGNKILGNIRPGASRYAASNRATWAGALRSLPPAGVRRMLLHQRGLGGAELGDDATVGTGPVAWDRSGVSRWLMCTAAPATVTTTTISKSHQPPRSEFTNLSQRPPTARGGVIARVRISTRQKLNRPLWSMGADFRAAAQTLPSNCSNSRRGSQARS